MPVLKVDAGDGTQLSLRVTGLDSGPAVLLCDGIGCDGYIWRYLRPMLEQRCRVLHFHYRGHGQSDVPHDLGTLTIDQCGRDVWQILDLAGISEVVLIGHSMGVQVILEATRQQPTRVRGLIAACGAFERPLDTFHGSDLGSKILPVLSGALFRWPDRVRRAWQQVVPTDFAYWMATATEINGSMIRRDDFLPYLKHMARMDPVVFMHFLQSVADHSARAHLPHLPMPALILAGANDNFTPAHLSEELARLLPLGELCRIPGGTHTAPLELPELVELRIEAFARRHRLWS